MPRTSVQFRYANMSLAFVASFSNAFQSRPNTGQSVYRRNGYLNEPTHFPLDQSYRAGVTNSNPPSRPGSALEAPRYNQFTGYANAVIPTGNMSPTMPPMSMPAPMSMYGQSNAMSPYPRGLGSIGTRLSPEAAEFSVDVMAPTPWNSHVSTMIRSIERHCC